MNGISNGVKIVIETTGQEFHSITDWGLAIGNNNCIGAPVQETSYITVPGASGDIDLSEVLTGRPVFKYRPINILFGGMRTRTLWDNVISDFRNHIDGKVVHLIFDNDLGFYWRGRVEIMNFDRVRELGKFKLNIPKADPYKYEVFSSNDMVEWDSFDFFYGLDRYIGPLIIDNTSLTILKGNMEVVPVFEIDTITSGELTVTVDEKTYSLAVGENRFPGIKVAGGKDVILQFSGSGTGKVKYRGGSL